TALLWGGDLTAVEWDPIYFIGRVTQRDITRPRILLCASERGRRALDARCALPRREEAPVRGSEHDDVKMRRMPLFGGIHHPCRFQRQQRVTQPREAGAGWTMQIQRDSRRMHRKR